jgi:thiol-disulfide isomerase/thioredoxin
VNRLLSFVFLAALGVAAAAWTVRATSVRPAVAPVAAPSLETPGARAPEFAPDFTLPTFGGGPVSLRDFRGRPLVINFWASWCVPCRTEMPILGEAARAWRGRVAFLGANVLDDEGKAADFLVAMKRPFVSAYDDGDGLTRLYRIVGLPTTVFIGADGRIAIKHAGPFLGAKGKALLERYLARIAQTGAAP